MKKNTRFEVWFEKQYGKRPLTHAQSIRAEGTYAALLIAKEKLDCCDDWDRCREAALFAWQARCSLCALQTQLGGAA